MWKRKEQQWLGLKKTKKRESEESRELYKKVGKWKCAWGLFEEASGDQDRTSRDHSYSTHHQDVS